MLSVYQEIQGKNHGNYGYNIEWERLWVQRGTGGDSGVNMDTVRDSQRI